MITGEIKSKVDAIWNAMWTGGLSNPQTVMEQLTLLLFLKGLDDAQTLAERQARARGTALERNLFPDGHDGIPIVDDSGSKIADGRPFADLRWARFVTLPAGRHAGGGGEPPDPLPAPARLRWRAAAQAHGERALRDPDRPAAVQGRRPDLRPADEAAGHQGRPLRIHAVEGRRGGAERPVPHTSPHHQAHGRHDRAAPG